MLIDKPVGITSHDVVAKVRHILQQAESSKPKAQSCTEKLSAKDFQLLATSPKVKVGHTGTLDPLASGLMILVLGSYTKRAQEFSKMDKTYVVELTLGATSATGDAEGPITGYPSSVAVAPQLRGTGSGQVTGNSKKPSEKEVRKVMGTFIGEISQTPHAHSAVKVGGQRAYKLARAGKDFKIEPRRVKIYSIENIKYDYPKLSFTTEVSSGTYIRSLAEDLGNKLGIGAYVSALKRTAVGKFDIKDSEDLGKLDILKLRTRVVKK